MSFINIIYTRHSKKKPTILTEISWDEYIVLMRMAHFTVILKWAIIIFIIYTVNVLCTNIIIVDTDL